MSGLSTQAILAVTVIAYAAWLIVTPRIFGVGRLPVSKILKYTFLGVFFFLGPIFLWALILNLTGADQTSWMPLIYLGSAFFAIEETGRRMNADADLGVANRPAGRWRGFAAAATAMFLGVMSASIANVVIEGTNSPTVASASDGSGSAAGRRLAQVPARPSCAVQDVRMEAKTDIVNGDFDWGVQLTGIIANQGPAQYLMVSADLSTSEGSFRRQQRLRFESGQMRHMGFFIHEPSAGAQNIAGEMSCVAVQ